MNQFFRWQGSDPCMCTVEYRWWISKVHAVSLFNNLHLAGLSGDQPSENLSEVANYLISLRLFTGNSWFDRVLGGGCCLPEFVLFGCVPLLCSYIAHVLSLLVANYIQLTNRIFPKSL